MKPWIETEFLARFEVFFEPVLGRIVDEMFGREGGGVDLLADLYGVAAINENSGKVVQHDGCAPRAGKAGEPCKALGRGGDVFVLVFIGTGHHEPVEPTGFEFCAQGFQMGSALGGRGFLIKSLKDGLGHDEFLFWVE